MTKRCPKCGEVKPLSAFHKNKCEKHGVHVYCKECRRELNRTYHINNHEKVIEYQRRYRADNAEKHREYHRTYRINNYEKGEEFNHKYVENLTDSYVRGMITAVKNPSNELIELKRQQILMYRMAKELRGRVKNESARTDV